MIDKGRKGKRMTAWFDYPVTHGYTSVYSGPGTDTPHYALDLGTPFHTPITTIKSGTIKQADFAPWGGEIFLVPDDGSTEEYWYHPDLLEVSAGQHVSAGQEIALSGGENPGYAGGLHPASTQYSTGPHTHFGLFTGWTQSPDHGTIPYGPDPTTLLAQGQMGLYSQANSTTSPNVSTDRSPATAIAAAGVGLSSGVQNASVRVGLFVLGLVILFGGVYLLFQKQINSGVSTGLTVAKEAVLA
jgi:murein DD-endopeptidase MepM/ murein hydrolase activator NlpD